MKYNQFAIKNQEGLWKLKEDAKKLSEYLMKHEGNKNLRVVEV